MWWAVGGPEESPWGTVVVPGALLTMPVSGEGVPRRSLNISNVILRVVGDGKGDPRRPLNICNVMYGIGSIRTVANGEAAGRRAAGGRASRRRRCLGPQRGGNRGGSCGRRGSYEINVNESQSM